MTVTFDTLTYSKRLREAGVPKEQADAHAGAALYLFRAVGPNRAVLKVPEARSDDPASLADLKSALDLMAWQVAVRVGGIMLVAFTVIAVLIVQWLGKATPPI
jgi:hypothetical protein